LLLILYISCKMVSFTILANNFKINREMEPGKILFIDTAHPVLKEKLVQYGFQCDYFPDFERKDFDRIIQNYVGIIIRSKIKIDQEIIDKAKKLKFIARVGAGMENINFDYAALKGIKCLNAPEGNRDAVGEHAIGMLLSLFNKLNIVDNEVRNGVWLREENRGVELGGKTIGIIGYGNTGGAFARKLAGFGVKILAYDKYKFDFSDEFVSESTMDDLFLQSDIISFHVPLTAETTYLCDKEFLEKFKKNFYLINTSRGKVVKTADLVEFLESGKVLGACLDVLENEKSSFESLANDKLPNELKRLFQMKNVILSPHIAGWTHESNLKMAMTIYQKITSLESL
jgi:D-3-phosphoglycerate dehydrogenase / 2-oxoglutarate reductase